MADFPYATISRFIGMNKTKNKLSLPIYSVGQNEIGVQLSENKNYLYLSSGGVEERGGGAKLTNGPDSSDSDICYGFANYQNNEGDEFLIAVFNANELQYYSSGWNNILAVTPELRTRFEGAGFSTGRALYGCNGVDGIIKVSTTLSVPVAAFVTDSPTDCVFLRLHKNRLFGTDGKDKLYFTEASDFDNWNLTDNSLYVAPGKDGKIQALEVWGDSLFIFKETAVYVLPNAVDDPANWYILKTDAATGTQSPDTVQKTKIGIIFWATDNYVRVISPTISFSSAEYTLGGSGSEPLSVQIQEDIQELADLDFKYKATAIVKNDLYIFAFNSINNADEYLDKCYFADLNKTLSVPTIVQPQPYWGEFTGFDYDYFCIQYGKYLYGVKGESGQIHETLNPDIHNDNGDPIVSSGVIAWAPIGGEGIYKKFKQLYFAGDTQNWNINLLINAYRYGSVLPGDDEGIPIVYSTSIYENVGIVGSAIVGISTIGAYGISSTRYKTNLKGHLFHFKFYNENADEFTRINKIIVYYRPIHSR